MDLAVLVWQKSFIVLFPSFYLYSTHFCQFFPFPPFSAEPRLKNPNFWGSSLGGAENFSWHGIFLIFGSWLPIDPLSSPNKSQEYIFTLRSKTVPVIWEDFELWISGHWKCNGTHPNWMKLKSEKLPIGQNNALQVGKFEVFRWKDGQNWGKGLLRLTSW